MKNMWVVPLTALVSVGCVGLSQEGRSVQVASSAPGDCAPVERVEFEQFCLQPGSGARAEKRFSSGCFDAARRAVRNLAGAAGANVVTLDGPTLDDDGYVRAAGDAFRCEGSTLERVAASTDPTGTKQTRLGLGAAFGADFGPLNQAGTRQLELTSIRLPIVLQPSAAADPHLQSRFRLEPLFMFDRFETDVLRKMRPRLGQG